VAAYYEGTIMYSAEIPYGSDLITRDLAIGLGTSFAIAEKVKIAHGAADPSCITADVDVEVRGDAGQVPLHVKTRAIANMIGPRLEEIFAMVNESLHNSGYVDLVLPGNIILAGGGSLLQGVADAIQKHMGFRVRAGAARPDLVQAEEQWLSPAYSTALGLLYCSNTPPCGVTLD
jgi:cell division protein FtsA